MKVREREDREAKDLQAIENKSYLDADFMRLITAASDDQQG